MEEEVNAGSVVQQQQQPRLIDYSHILQLTDTTQLLEITEHALKNEFLNGKGDWEKIPGTKQIMSDQGIYRFIAKMHTILNRHVSMSNFPDQMKVYNKIMSSIVRTINNDIFINRSYYDLKITDVQWAKQLIIEPIQIYLTKALSDRERKHIFGNPIYQTTQRHYQPKERGNDFAMFNKNS